MARAYRTKRQQLELVAQWRASGSSRKAFCAKMGITPVTLKRWLSLEPVAMTFAEVLPAARPVAAAAVVVLLPSGTRLLVEPGASVPLVAELARVLG